MPAGSTPLLPPAFSDPLALARHEDPNDVHACQQRLVDAHRAAGRPFLATMPLRHRFACPACGLREGEAVLHVEDPRQPAEGPVVRGLFGMPAGRFVALDRSGLHRIEAHGEPVPPALAALLAGAHA